MNVQLEVIRHEAMRIAGTRVDTEERIDVYNPYTNKLVGTVSTARPEHVRAAFAKAKAFKSKLTRYERQQILLKTSEILPLRKEEFAGLIPSETGPCWKYSTYDVGRACDVYSFAAHLTIKDHGESFTADISLRCAPRTILTM